MASVVLLGVAAVGCATPREQALRSRFDGLAPEPSLAVSYTIWNGTTGAPASLEEVLERAADADAIFFGEHHYERVGNALSAQILQYMIAQDRPVSLAMEFFTRDEQADLDAYLAGKIDESSFRERTTRGPRYLLSHRPLIELCRRADVPVIGAGIAREKWSLWRESGIEDYAQWRATLAEGERASFPRKCERLRDAYWEAIRSFRHGDEAPEKEPTAEEAAAEEARQWGFFKTQAMWDDSFAEAMADEREREPARRVFLVVGAFHVHRGLGTLTKYRARRPNDRILVISMSSENEEGADLSFVHDDFGLADFVVHTVVPPEEKPPEPPKPPEKTDAEKAEAEKAEAEKAEPEEAELEKAEPEEAPPQEAPDAPEGAPKEDAASARAPMRRA